MKKWLFGFLALMLVVTVSAMADQINGLASSSQVAPTQLQNLYVNPGGMGDVLVFPYYNVRNGNALNYFKIVNTSDRGVIGKLRIREGKESKEVLDFIVCLSPHDEFSFWMADPNLLNISGVSGNTAVVIRRGGGLVADTDTIVAPGGWDVAETRTLNVDDPSRTFEGYIEFFGLSSVDGSVFEERITNAEACKEAAEGTLDVELGDVPDALIGEGYIFDLNTEDTDGVATYAYKAVAFAHFQNRAISAGLTTDLPLFDDAAATLVGVNYALTKTNLYVMYDLNSNFQGQTDVILNFLTKKENIDKGYMQYYCTACNSSDYTKCCVCISAKIYDDKENSPEAPKPGVDFSPQRPEHPEIPKVCNEVTYMPVGTDETILDTGLKELKIDTSYELGWARISFDNGYTTLGDVTLRGQPVLAYQLMSYYGGIVDHMLPVNYDVLRGGEAGGGAQCDAQHLNLCASKEDCNNAGGFWYNNSCHSCDEECPSGLEGLACNLAKSNQCM